MMDRYRLGTLQWVPLDLSRYKQVVSWMHGLFQGFAIPRILRRFGNRRAGEIAAVILGFGIICWGNCFRFFKNRSFGFTPFLVTYTLIQLVSHNTVRVARNPNLQPLEKPSWPRFARFTPPFLADQGASWVGQWESVSRFSIQASIVEEGIHVTDSGRGELNAAIEGLDLLVQVIMPPLDVSPCVGPHHRITDA